MDELEKLMLEIGEDGYITDMEYLQYILEKEKESRERVLQMIALYFSVKTGKSKLMKSIFKEVDSLFDTVEESFQKTIADTYRETFLKTVYNVGKTVGMRDFSIPDLPNMKWHIGKQSYIDDLMYYRNRLKYDLRKNINKGIILNQSTSEIDMIVDKPFKTLLNSTKRMADTELAYVERQANSDAFESQGMEQYKFVATLDTVTCDVCADLDGKVFNIKDKEVGVNYPPIHPSCRCCVVGNIDFTQRAARNTDGKTIYVDGNMTYEEWKQKYGK